MLWVTSPTLLTHQPGLPLAGKLEALPIARESQPLRFPKKVLGRQTSVKSPIMTHLLARGRKNTERDDLLNQPEAGQAWLTMIPHGREIDVLLRFTFAVWRRRDIHQGRALMSPPY